MGREYAFNGSADAGKVSAKNSLYSNINTPLDLYDALEHIWCAETCAPRLRDGWSEQNRTLGQCSVTAFLAQDIFGGEVRGMKTENGIHCYNCVDGICFDLASEQFGEKAASLEYGGSDEVQDRMSDYHFGKEEKRLRYEYLKNALAGRMNGRLRKPDWT